MAYVCGSSCPPLPPPRFDDPTLENLYRDLQYGVPKGKIEARLFALEKADKSAPETAQLYLDFVNVIMETFVVTLGRENRRVVVTEPDGTVVVDTGKDAATNTLANWMNKAINENHNSRVAILNAQLLEDGIGHERKYSSSTGTFQAGVAQRLGLQFNNAGGIRLSLDVFI